MAYEFEDEEQMEFGDSFQQFMDKVNAYTISQCGMSTSEFDDYHYRDCFDEGLDPEETGDEAMDNAGLMPF